MTALHLEDMVQSRELGHADGGMELAQPKVQTDMRMVIRSAINAQMIVAMIGKGLRQAVQVVVIGQDGATLAARNRRTSNPPSRMCPALVRETWRRRPARRLQ